MAVPIERKVSPGCSVLTAACLNDWRNSPPHDAHVLMVTTLLRIPCMTQATCRFGHASSSCAGQNSRHTLRTSPRNHSPPAGIVQEIASHRVTAVSKLVITPIRIPDRESRIPTTVFPDRRSGGPAGQPSMHVQIERRQHEQREQRRRDQPADHDHRERSLDLGAVQRQHEQRQQAERGRAGRHQLRAHAADAGFPHGLAVSDALRSAGRASASPARGCSARRCRTDR